MAVGAMLAPPALLLLLGAYRPAYLKFMMASVPAMAAVAALPLHPEALLQPPTGSYVRRVWALLAVFAFLAGLLPVQITALGNLYTDPAYRRDDYRGIAARIEAEVTRDDAIVLSAPNQWEVFTYYYRGTAPVHPAPYRPSEDEAEAWIAGIVEAHNRIFVLYWGDQESDPERHIERALARQAYKAGETWITSVRYARYGTGPLASTPGTEVSRSFGPAIDLRGVTLPDEAVRGGAIVPLTLFWRSESTPDRRFKVFVHVLNADGRLAAQTDREPVGGLYPTDRWQPDETVVDRYGVSLPVDIQPGAYTVIAGLYDFSGERLRVTGPDGVQRDHVTLGTLTVRSPQ
jgi:hypothetical protein